jgi:hypothetical protein
MRAFLCSCKKDEAALEEKLKEPARRLYHQMIVSDNVLANHAALIKRDSEVLNA